MRIDMLHHWLKNGGLILLSLVFLPVSTAIVVSTLIVNLFVPTTTARRIQNAAQRKTVLVTGVGMTKGLVLARLFYQAGWKVIGADVSPAACGRLSKSLTKFYTLPPTDVQKGSAAYVDRLLQIIATEQVDLWVSCSTVTAAVEDGEGAEIIEARTACRAIQFDAETTTMLHEKHTFQKRAAEHGLTIPETRKVTNHTEAEETLRRAPSGRKYIMKPIGVDDANRGDMTLLPKASWPETTKHLGALTISLEAPWILQQFVDGKEYCTHSLVIRGSVKAFVACPSAELLMHYQALPQESKLHQAMLEFTRTFAAKEGENFSGHLSFDFITQHGNRGDKQSEDLVLYPIECNPRAHTAVVLFDGQPDMISGYEAILKPPGTSSTPGADGSITKDPITPHHRKAYYWIGHDLVELLIQPLWAQVAGKAALNFDEYCKGLNKLFDHVQFWYDGTYVGWDPLPWWWLYHVSWPMEFFKALVSGVKWSRINVSTGKMFKC